jgi:purine-binding chemotaxis protein CheW
MPVARSRRLSFRAIVGCREERENQMSEYNQEYALRQDLTFKLDEEMFALDVVQVREVLDVTTITKVPRAAAFMRGVINVRGSVVPVVDLRLKFGMTPIETTVDTRIVVMEIVLDGDTTVLGALADSVRDVMDMSQEHIEPAPKIGAKLDTQFIRGIGKHNDEFIIILDIDKVFSTEEVRKLADAEAGTPAEVAVA